MGKCTTIIKRAGENPCWDRDSGSTALTRMSITNATQQKALVTSGLSREEWGQDPWSRMNFGGGVSPKELPQVPQVRQVMGRREGWRRRGGVEALADLASLFHLMQGGRLHKACRNRIRLDLTRVGTAKRCQLCFSRSR